jgi:hypothetical protein
MISITPSTIAGTFNATAADIEDLIGRTPDHIDALGARLAQVDVLAGLTLSTTIVPKAPERATARTTVAPNTNPAAPVVSSSAALRHDPVASVAFLKSFDVSGWHNLWTLHPETGVKTGRTFAPDSWDEIAAFIDAHQGANVYFSPNEPKPDAPDDKLKREHIGAVRAVWSDFDPDEKLELIGEGKAERGRIEKLSAERLADPDAPPTVIIDSGGGHQLLWCLAEKLSAEQFGKRCEDQTKGILVRFGGDPSVWDTCRVLRLPGTVNRPHAKKRARGRTSRQASVLAETGQRYTLGALAQWTAPVETPAGSANADAWLDINWSDAREATCYEDLPKTLRRKFEDYCSWRPAVKNLWDGEAPTHGDGTASTRLYKLAGLLRSLAFTPLEYVQLYNVWDYQSENHQHDFERCVSRAWNRNPMAIGIGSAKPNASGFEAVELFVDIAPPLEPFDPADLPDIPWVIENFVARRSNVILVGPGGASKSTFAMQVAVALATGRSDICGYPIRKRARVWMLNQEDDLNFMNLRLAAVMQAFGVTWDDLRDDKGEFMLRMRSGLGDRLSLVERDGTMSGFKPGKGLAPLIASVKSFRADFVILDPLVSLHQGNELANHEMRAVMDILGRIGVECDAGMLSAHHTPKPDKTSSRGFAGNVNAARGASAIVDAARGTVTLMGMSEDDEKRDWKLPPGESRSKFVRLDDARMSFCAQREEPWWFKREPIHIGGNKRKSSYVLRPFKLEAKIKTATDTLHNVAKVIAERLSFGTPHAIDAVLPHLQGSDATQLKDRNRSRALNNAFGGAGVNEYLTDFGKLTRANRGNKGTVFTLHAPASAPQNVSEAQTSN